jgi:hypothetical protein
MEPYLLHGLVLPERAQLSFGPSEFEYRTLDGKRGGRASINVVLNNVTVWWHTDDEWDLYDLRNTVARAVLNEISIIGFVRGYGYDVEIRQVLHSALGIDYVYGIEIPCLVDRNAAIDLNKRFNEIRLKTSGELGIYLAHCLEDLRVAMKYPHDTAFHCHRAMESLRHYCAKRFKIDANEKAQWQKLAELTKTQADDVADIRELSKRVRHGEIVPISSAQRAEIFLKTWRVVEAFIDNA